MISPVYYTTEGDNGSWTHDGFFNNTLNSYMNHASDGFYSAQKRLNRFPGIVETGRAYNVTYTGTLPSSMRYQLQGTTSDDEGVVLTISYVRPETVRVSVGATKSAATIIDPIVGRPDKADSMVNPTSASGTN